MPSLLILKVLDPERIAAYSIKGASGLQFNYAASPVDDRIISILSELAKEQELIPKYRSWLTGQ